MVVITMKNFYAIKYRLLNILLSCALAGTGVSCSRDENAATVRNKPNSVSAWPNAEAHLAVWRMLLEPSEYNFQASIHILLESNPNTWRDGRYTFGGNYHNPYVVSPSDHFRPSTEHGGHFLQLLDAAIADIDSYHDRAHVLIAIDQFLASIMLSWKPSRNRNQEWRTGGEFIVMGLIPYRAAILKQLESLAESSPNASTYDPGVKHTRLTEIIPHILNKTWEPDHVP